jgi:nuclear pore complex protein Nup85
VYDSGLRRHFILTYAESILSDPGLWRMAVEYMAICDEIGLQTAREVLLHVPLRILESITDGDSAASPSSHLEDLLEVCDEHDFQDTKANICRVGGLLLRCMIV